MTASRKNDNRQVADNDKFGLISRERTSGRSIPLYTGKEKKKRRIKV